MVSSQKLVCIFLLNWDCSFDDGFNQACQKQQLPDWEYQLSEATAADRAMSLLISKMVERMAYKACAPVCLKLVNQICKETAAVINN